MKKFAALVLILALLAGATACGRASSASTAAPPDISNETYVLYDIHHQKMGSFDYYGSMVPINGSIVYSKISDQSTKDNLIMDYYRYIISTGQNMKLGTIKEWASQSSESVCIQDHLFLIVVTGDWIDEERRVVKLLDVDLAKNTFREVFAEKDAFPYYTMVGVEDQLWIARSVSNGNCVDAYNLKTKKFKTIARFQYDNPTNTGEMIRQISADDQTVSLMMLVKESSDSVRLRIDVYDHQMNYLRSVDATDISSEPNERAQGIVNFQFSNNLLFYRNFSVTCVLGEAQNGRISTSIVDNNGTFCMAYENDNSMKKVLYRLLSENNEIYLWNMQNGVLLQGAFFADDPRYRIDGVYQTGNGECYISMNMIPSRGGERTWDSRLYCVNLADLKFEQAA